MTNKKSQIFVFLHAHAHNGSLFGRFLYAFYCNFVLHCDISYRVKIGEGFQIFHGASSTIVSPSTIIGKNVSLRQNTTIGAKGFDGDDNSPVIEDDVTIGPNSCIIGRIRVGKGAVIGAGAVVVKDVPQYSVVVGNPARVIKTLNDEKN